MNEAAEVLKSVEPVLNQRHGWIVRVRTKIAAKQAREVFLGLGAGYTMAQAQMYANTLRRDIARHGIESALT